MMMEVMRSYILVVGSRARLRITSIIIIIYFTLFYFSFLSFSLGAFSGQFREFMQQKPYINPHYQHGICRFTI